MMMASISAIEGEDEIAGMTEEGVQETVRYDTSSLKTGPARPGQARKITILTTAVAFHQSSLYSTGSSLFCNDHM